MGKKKIEIPTATNCRECDYGNCYNDDWCECYHPLVNPSKVQIACGCVVRSLTGVVIYKAKMDLDKKVNGGYEDYGVIPKGSTCFLSAWEGGIVISYNGKAICDPDSNMAKTCFEKV